MSEKPDGPAMQVNFRMPLGLKEMLQSAADSAGRSLTQEINLRLLDSFSYIHIPAELRTRLRAAADENGRHIDDEIARRLHASFAPRRSSEEFFEAVGELLHEAATELRADFAIERRFAWEAIQELAELAGDKVPEERRKQIAQIVKGLRAGKPLRFPTKG